jgi:dGTPase
MVDELFDALVADPASMPQDWSAGWHGLSDAARAERVADYIAGMTDRFARNQHRALVGRAAV